MKEIDVSERIPEQARFGDLLESMPDAIIVADQAGLIVLANTHAKSLFGYSEQELVGKALEELMPERFRAAHPRDVAGYFAQPRVRPIRAGIELFGLRANGEEFPVEISLSPIRMGGAIFAVSAIRDVTERRRLEDSIRKANRMKSEFLANMSHELRTPLNGIIGFTEFLADEKPGPLNPKQKEYLNDVHTSALHLLQLINDLLDLAKVEAGKIRLQPEPFSPGRVIEETRAVVNGIAQAKSIHIRSSISPEIGTVFLDPRKFKQICYNLLANAVKFTNPGGSVEIEAAPHDAAHFEVRVRDTGIGIRREDVDRLFREFEQLDSGAARRFGGTGLGLALTRRLVEMQGGTISVQSQYGRGSTFTVTLPAVSPAPFSDE